MTAAEKQQKAEFLALARDFIFSGYRMERKEYHFEDDAAAENPRIETAETCENSAGAEPDTIEKIADEIRACINCPLAKTRTNTAAGEGAQNPLVMVIGEGPGEEEDKQGRPFVGKAGQLLDKMLGSIELSRNTNCFIANIVKCRPPNNRDPLPEEEAACAHFLERQIALLKPKYILAVGRVAAQALLKTEEALGKLRGRQLELIVRGETFPLFVTYHPSALLRNEALKRPTWEDLKTLRSILDSM